MLILASQSRTRIKLLSGAGLSFRAEPAAVDERLLEAQMLDQSPGAIAGGLAIAKARAVSVLVPNAVVIGADQVLALDGAVLHKANDIAAARERLDALRNRTHALHAGVALVSDGTVLWSTVDTAGLSMRDFSAQERDEVLALEGEGVLGSVGAYRLEGPSIRLFSRVEGDYFTILGLPLLPLLAALRVHAPQTFSAR
ncbi:MAG: Maf family protein [Devosia sp.]